jgi:micrococcal nuclease
VHFLQLERRSIGRWKTVLLSFALTASWATLAANETKGSVEEAQARPKRTAGELQGRVVRVVDGDTVWIVPRDAPPNAAPIKLRIEGIDAPEICQAHGDLAQRALSERVMRREVRAKVRATDDYGRRLGKLYDGEVDIGEHMVREGHAWSARYRWSRGPYVEGERRAQSSMRGLHADAGAELPRDFRRRHGSCHVPANGRAS